MFDHSYIKKLAAGVGFDLCGVAPCRHLIDGEARFREWLAGGYQSSLAYLERNTEKRFDPRKLVDEARTAVVCAVGYKNRASDGYPAGHRTKVASYACAEDYHTLIRGMLHRMFDELRRIDPDIRGRAFVDTAPLAEKLLAVEAGLGWIGRQSLVVTPELGSFIVLGELILTAEVDRYDTPFAGSRCGTCHACAEACPTGAVMPGRGIDTSRCISCHTIEREPRQRIDLDGWIFGCDACQSCCPWNRRAPQHRNPAFDPQFDPLGMDEADWQRMDEDAFERLCGRTPLTRSGLERIRGNIAPSGPAPAPSAAFSETEPAPSASAASPETEPAPSASTASSETEPAPSASAASSDGPEQPTSYSC